MRKRVLKFFNQIKPELDAILIKNSNSHIDMNFFYFTGLVQGLFENAQIIVYPDGTIDLIVSELEAETAKKTTAHVHVYKNYQEYEKILTNLSSNLKKIGINYNAVPYQSFLNLKKIFPNTLFTDISKDLIKTRLTKDSKEIENIKKACEITDRVVYKIPELLREGISEYELAAEMNFLMQKNGADKPAFDTISSFAQHTAEPHYTHGDTQLNINDFVLCDFGACFKKYNADVTRTFMFGKANEKQIEMYETVKKAQKIGLDMIEPGVSACDVHKNVALYIDSTQFKGRFIHSTGHSLGIEVHDGPGFTSENTMFLEENMVLTVEPGIYILGYGGVRIEDDIIVTKNGFEFLSHASKEIFEV